MHVSVESDEEGVGVLDRIRVWLPSLLALSANSPFWNGQDSGYASYRSQAFARWPSWGPTDRFGSAEAYHRLVRKMVLSSVILDAGMVYFDARLSQHYPTVEIRSADVCFTVEEAIVVAALCRGLVETAAQRVGGRHAGARRADARCCGSRRGRPGGKGSRGSLIDWRTGLPEAVLVGARGARRPRRARPCRRLETSTWCRRGSPGVREEGNGAIRQRADAGAHRAARRRRRRVGPRDVVAGRGLARRTRASRAAPVRSHVVLAPPIASSSLREPRLTVRKPERPFAH